MLWWYQKTYSRLVHRGRPDWDSKRHEKLVLVKLVHPSIHRTSNMYTQCCQFQNCKRKIEVHYYDPFAKRRLKKIGPNNHGSYVSYFQSFPDSLTIGEVTKITAPCALYKYLSTKRWHSNIFLWEIISFLLGIINPLTLSSKDFWPVPTGPLWLSICFQDQALRSSVPETFNLLISKEPSVGAVYGRRLFCSFPFPWQKVDGLD